MSKLTEKELAKAFGNAVNKYGFDKDKFIEQFNKEHNTIQQSMFGVCLAMVKHVASDDFYVDDRNEQSQKIARQLLSGYKTELVKEYTSQGDSEERAKGYAETGVERIDCLGFI